MKVLNSRDVLVEFVYMKTVGILMARGDPDVSWNVIYITQGNFTGAPPTYFYYGGDEVLAACAKKLVVAYEKTGAKYTMYIELGMCHCYPMLTWFPEGKMVYEEIVEILFQK